MNSLICKFNNLPIKKSLYNGKVKPPRKAVSYDIVKIKKTNNSRIDIITFRDKAKETGVGKILRRYIIDKGQWGEVITERNYCELKKSTINNPKKDSQTKKLNITGRKITSLLKFENEYFEKSTETQTVTHLDDNRPILHISKVSSQPFRKDCIENESQSMFEYQNGKPKKGYSIKTLLKSREGYIDDIFEPIYKFVNFTQKAEKRLKKDDYLPLHLYSFKEFKKFAPTVAQYPKHKTELSFPINWFKDNNKNRLGFFNGYINLNDKALTNRFSVINTSAHEKEHAYQMEQCVFYDLKKGIKTNPKYISKEFFDEYLEYYSSGGKCKVNDKAEVLLTKKDYKNYIPSDKDRKSYTNQFVEISARIAGGTAEYNYKKSAKNLKKEFPYAPDYLIGFTESEGLARAWEILHSTNF